MCSSDLSVVRQIRRIDIDPGYQFVLDARASVAPPPQHLDEPQWVSQEIPRQRLRGRIAVHKRSVEIDVERIWLTVRLHAWPLHRSGKLLS